MTLGERLRGVTRVFLDTAPVIYYVEGHPTFAGRLDSLFDRLDQGSLAAVTSPVTLSECLVYPFKDSATALRDAFVALITSGSGVTFSSIDQTVAVRAAELRARYGLSLLDAFQVAAALESRCEMFVANDDKLRRVTEIPVLVLTEFQ